MKKFLGLGLLAIAFASCSDDDGPNVDMNQLAKKWYFSSYSVAGQTFPDEDNEPCGKDNIEFAAGTYTAIDVYDCVDGAPVSDVITGTYTVDGHIVTLNIFGESSTATVTELTATSLKVSYQDDFNDDGNSVTIIETYTSTP
jgi:hypothetical protein